MPHRQFGCKHRISAYRKRRRSSPSVAALTLGDCRLSAPGYDIPCPERTWLAQPTVGQTAPQSTGLNRPAGSGSPRLDQRADPAAQFGLSRGRFMPEARILIGAPKIGRRFHQSPPCLPGAWHRRPLHRTPESCKPMRWRGFPPMHREGIDGQGQDGSPAAAWKRDARQNGGPSGGLCRKFHITY